MKRNTKQRVLNDDQLRLSEDDGGFDYAGAMSDTPYGMHFGSPSQLYSTFVKPFTDVAKTAAGKTSELSARAQTSVAVAFEALATSVIPVLSSDYGEIFASEKRKLDSIKQRYADVYGSTWSALGGTDVMVAAFMFAPWAFLSAEIVKKSPKAALSLVQMLGGGNAMIERFVSKIKSKYSKGGGNQSSDKWSTRENPQGDTMAFEGTEFLGYVLLEDSDKKANVTRKPLAAVLTSDKLQKALQKLPTVQRMQSDGHKLIDASLRSVLQRAQKFMQAKTIEDVERAIGKRVPKLTAALKKVEQGNRSQVEAAVLKNIFAAAKKYYISNLTQQAKTAIEAGIAHDHPYIKAYADTIAKIGAL